MIRTMLLVGISSLLVLGCGKKDGGAGDWKLAAAAKDVAKRFCECPDNVCADAVKSDDGKTSFHIFFEADTKDLNEEQMKTWQAARSQWNDCTKPGYVRSGNDPEATKTKDAEAPNVPMDAAPESPDTPIADEDDGDVAPPWITDDEAHRAGKKTGLGGADEKPEVVTEDLIIAIADGKVKASRIIDPAFGVYELLSLPGAMDPSKPDKKKRHCGASAGKIVLGHAKAMKQGRDDEILTFFCSNQWLAKDNPDFGGASDGEPKRKPHPLRYAVCDSDSPSEWGENYMVIFVPDETRGLRIAGVFVTESGVAGSIYEQKLADFADEIVKPTPCK